MKYRNTLKKRVLAGLLAGVAACAAAPVLAASGVIPNTQLPDGGHFVAGGGAIGDPSNGQMTITQTTQNGVIKWDSFNVGANATVNFNGDKENFNTLNYVNSANGMSQIYGAINANNNGNIYIVNAAGVEIGNSAQINVGSLYVSNRNLDNVIDGLNPEKDTNPDISKIMGSGVTTDAALMSLGNINASSVTFDGGRVVIDTERLKTGDDKMTAENIIVHTTDADNVVIGYEAYDETDGYAGKDKNISDLATVTENGTAVTDLKGYMWVKDIQQLQDIDTNLGGSYALRNSIDATATQDWNSGDGDATAEGFKPIGVDENGKVTITSVDGENKYGFYGKFDGLDYNIFNLNIDREGESHVGLFGVVHDAVINNVTFVGGSIAGGNVVGSLAGAVVGKSHISNITNSASVTGATDVGGIVGYSGNILKNVGEEGSEVDNIETQVEFSDLINTGTVKGEDHTGTPTEHGNNIGGLIGNLYNGSLGGTSYNLGSVTGEGHNVGGLVGHAYASTLGDGTNLIYNRLDVEGAYNVGGIVGSMEGTTVQNAENSGTVTATGYTDGKYSYHTAHYDENTGAVDGVMTVDVDVANVGGIAGSASHVEGHESKLENVLNTGGVSSAVAKENGYDYYTAGNVGGIVGSAVDTDITNATNRENDIRGAHNVGGVAGYFSGTGEIKTGTNDGGDILATGARHDGNFVKEWVRGGTTGDEEAIIGNMGGIVGYMDGDNVYITSSANRGTVHSQDILGSSVPLVSQAANAGGIVGKIDRRKTLTKDELGDTYAKAAVSNSYNTGDVRGYMGVGGVAGMMYNGEIAGSYNLGTVQTTRNAESFGTGQYYSVNMGGVVGDTTEGTSASALLYDVYNKGQIGDENFDYYARHVGGIVGRLSGTVEKAYNTGAIYNGYNVVGGIAGWFYKGSISNAFNTGNITVVNKEGLAGETSSATSQVGGIVGGAQSANHVTIDSVYNLGTLRVFDPKDKANISLGGIVGAIRGNGSMSITNAYTTGNLYAAKYDANNHEYELAISNTIAQDYVYVGSIWGQNESNATLTQENTYYIRPQQTESTPQGEKYLFPVLGSAITEAGNKRFGTDNSNKAIDFANKSDINEYQYGEGENHHKLDFTTESNGAISRDEEGNVTEDWRIYKGSTPILNAFLPNTEEYFSENGLKDSNGQGGFTVQYGTAYDPLLTIIKANTADSLTFNWIDLGANNAAGIAVYGADLTLKDFMSTGGSGYFGGLIYSDGALSLVAHKGEESNKKDQSITGDVALGSAAELYGSSVAIDATGDVTIYGDVTATGNIRDGASDDKDATKGYKDHSGNITITGGNVDIYGQLTSGAVNEPVKGIGSIAAGWTPGNVADPKEAMSDIGDRFGYTTSGSDVNGHINITATDASDGHVNVYYGNQEEGFLDAAGDLTVSAAGDIYIDSDLKVGGDLTLNSPGEMVLDLTNVGQVQADKGLVTDALAGLHEFMHHFEKKEEGQTSYSIAFKNENGEVGATDAKLTVDMWNYNDGKFDLTKFDSTDHTFLGELNGLNLTVGEKDNVSAKDHTYIWVSTGDMLKGIQAYKNDNADSNILDYNFALKNDIDASTVTDYKAIGTGSANGYTGTFDGRDNRVIGLNVTGDNAGIFDKVGTMTDGDNKVHTGTVEDLRVYSGTFSGSTHAGAVAGVNEGNISNVTAFGNTVMVNGENGYAGGIVGTNSGTIDNVTVSGTATEASEKAEGNASVAGGIAGLNDKGGTISNSSSNSAVNSSKGYSTGLGGVVGDNQGTLENVDSLGVTTGLYMVKHEDGSITAQYSDNVGGIAGTNSGSISNAYNESIVSGKSGIGGIVGKNEKVEGVENSGVIENVSNAASVTGESASGSDSKYVGGLVGDNQGAITGGRNNGTITGENYVGGLVGNNASADSKLENLVNDEAAAITGDNYVGGIAGSNSGTISAKNQENLINRGSITGQNFVGGIAGENLGTIEYVKSNINLHVHDANKEAKYFGGVAGINGRLDDPSTAENEYAEGTITSATNEADVIAPNADYVGGIVGWNTAAGKLEGMGNSNEGRVEGNSHVGGVAGKNDRDIAGAADAMVGIENSGVVIAHRGGAGGIFGENTGDIQYAEITNKGVVSGTYSGEEGTNGTGGIFGVNSGDVKYSSMKNETGGQVMGTQNVGGLIGVNTGDITGGRTDVTKDGQTVDNGYYKYQIYNNGTIKAGTWNDADKDGVVDEGEFSVAVNGSGSQNIAGLIGINQKKEDGTGGTITAGYNTGVINADNSTNVGGIAGTNEGTLDQVFNTVITADGQNQTITGGTNVGGLVGSNTGMISNAYNTSTVKGTTSGSLVGTNGGFVSNVYAINGESYVDGDKLIGEKQDGSTLSNVYSNGSFGEGGSTIDKVGGQSAIWRQYGDNNPILKIFLTTVTYDPTKNDQNLVYNGKDQTLDITGNGFSAADHFEAHNSVTGGLIYHDVDGEHKNAGTYIDNLWSEQIKAGGEGDTFNPNHLGYDVQSVEYTIHQKELTIDLGDVTHEYGTPNLNQYTGNFTVSGWVDGENFLSEISLSDIDDGGLKDNNNHTQDVGDYEWSADVSIGGTLGQGGAGNYKISGTPTAGKSTVTQKTITVNLGDVSHTYGDTQDLSKYGIEGQLEWGNGDAYTNDDVSLSNISDTAFDDTTGHTNNAGGEYSWSANVSGAGDDAERINKNYKFEIIEGDSDIDKKGITINLGDVSHVYGTPNNDGYTFTADGWAYDEDFSKDVNIGSLGDGITDNALKDNNHHTQDVNQDGYTWTTDKAGISGDGATNYYVESIVDGKSAVTPVTIDVELGDISHEYGTPNDEYGIKNDIAWVNGDTYTDEDVILSDIQDNALKDQNHTKHVDDYVWSASVSGSGSDANRINGNYVFNVKQGTSKVTPKDLHITVDDKDIYVGEPVPEYTGHMDDLVNGDTMTEAPVYGTDPAEEIDTTQPGSHGIGVQFGDKYISSGEGYDWTKVWNGFKNYNVIFDPGTLTVKDIPGDVPDITPGEHWNFLFDDNPWDRNRDFRERKAEVHFVAGGMTL